MTYAIKGLSPDMFDQYRGLDDEALARLSARRVKATSRPGFPCRVSLEDADEGESLILLQSFERKRAHRERPAVHRDRNWRWG